MRTHTSDDIRLISPIGANCASAGTLRGISSRGVAGPGKSAAVRIGIVLTLTAMGLAVGGCYERVIRATGPATDRQRISEPYQQNYEIDEWIFGTKVPDVRKRP
ncbi:MAG: hypothetical protein MUE97_01560 [Phycisphaerales bacterium]|jgi:hypothetical protein|nr:hypothetical protein [Phycisphaerales bacterium]